MDITNSLAAIVNAADRITTQIGTETRNRLRNSKTPERRRYKVSAIRDSRTCQLCRYNDGALVIANSEDSVEAIANRMENTPPFHTNCRCVLDPVGIFRGVL